MRQMEIKVLSEDSPYTFALIGRLDTSTAPQLEEFIKELENKNIKDITVDMGECDFVSSAGLRVIVSMQKRASSPNVGGTLVFANVQSDIMDVFSMTGFEKILTFA